MERLALIIFVLALPAAAAAGPPSSTWQLDFPVTVTAGSYQRTTASGSTRLDTVWVSAGLELSARRGPWKTAVFADRWVSNNPAMDGTINTGASLRFDTRRSDWLTVIMNFRSSSGGDSWALGERFRYHVLPRHKFGLELLGEPNRPEHTRLALGYWGTIAPRLSAIVVYGGDVFEFRNRSARIEFCWEIH